MSATMVGVIVFLVCSVLCHVTTSSPTQGKPEDFNEFDERLDFHELNSQQFVNQNSEIRKVQVNEYIIPAHLNLNQRIQNFHLQAQNINPSVSGIKKKENNVYNKDIVPLQIPIKNLQNVNRINEQNGKVFHTVAANFQNLYPSQEASHLINDNTGTHFSERQTTPQKIITFNDNDKASQGIVLKPQTFTSALLPKIIPRNYDIQSHRGNRFIIKGKPNHEVYNYKPLPSHKEENIEKYRKIPVIEVIHDEIPPPVYNTSVTVLPNKYGTGGSWSKNSLHDIVKKSLIHALDSLSIKLSPGDYETISDEVTLAVTESLGLLRSGTQEVQKRKRNPINYSPDTTTQATSPILFPVPPQKIEPDPSFKKIHEIKRYNNGNKFNEPLDENKSTESKSTVISEALATSASLSQANFNTNAAASSIELYHVGAPQYALQDLSNQNHKTGNQKNLVRGINHEETEIIEREKIIEKETEREKQKELEEEEEQEENESEEQKKYFEEDC